MVKISAQPTFFNAVIAKSILSFFPKNLGRHSYSVRRCNRKTCQNKLENQFFGPILTISAEYNKTRQISIALSCIPSLTMVSKEIDFFWGRRG